MLKRALPGLLLLPLLLVSPAALQAQPLSSRDSFRIGSGGSVLCTAQSRTTDPALRDMFDQAYSIVCRDAEAIVGQLFVLRNRGGDPAARLAAMRANSMACQPGEAVEIEGLGRVERLSCRLNAAEIDYRVYQHPRGNTLYVAQGFAGYDSALRLGLHSIVADRPVDGDVSVATTGAGNPAAFARIQAGTLDPQRRLAEAYRRNNAGSYAEASEYFATLTQGEGGDGNRAEALVNEALQKSALGRYSEADSLFSRAHDLAGADPVTARRLRNYRAMHFLNQGMAAAAVEALDQSVPPIGLATGVAQLVIERPLAGRLSAESPGADRLRGQEGLTQEDKAQILDGQAQHLRGVVLRRRGQNADAAASFNRALDELAAVRRSGRIGATLWLRAQIHGELAGLAEAREDQAGADRQHQLAIDLLRTGYPGSSALDTASGRLAGYYARTGRDEPAIALFRAIVAANAESGDSSAGLRRTLQPYFALRARHGDDPAAAADLFAASQVLVRPGVAHTQALLARQLSGGSDEAAGLFRQSVDLTRQIESGGAELTRLEASEAPTPAGVVRMAELRILIGQWQQGQVATQARLAGFPRYRVVSSGAFQLADLQRLLRPGEAYYKMIVIGDEGYAIFATAANARAFRLGARPAELDRQVDALRATISVVEEGQQLTYPFNLELAHSLYQSLFGPVAAELAGISHLIFEPDGAMLRLPPNLLVMDRAAVDAYRARRAANPDDDGFDFRGIRWLGRERDISTAVSARAFRDVRQTQPSRARAEYLGFGENAPAQDHYLPPGGRRGPPRMDPGCRWSLSVWNRPISARELVEARNALAGGRPDQAEIVTGADFTDSAIKSRDDLDQYRILHFATHGLVTPPRPECPARPALLTSFGGEGSDGLLNFAEIFDLHLDADLVILSACDTAGRASAVATAEAGLSGSGEFALDGLVRAFVGAGGRLVVASHWPVPDDYDATERLISGLFQAPRGTGTAGALRIAQQRLMDERDTSHPYYWSGFAVVGDGTAPVIRPAAATGTASR